MNINLLLQGLSYEKTPFPFSWEEVVNPSLCCCQSETCDNNSNPELPPEYQSVFQKLKTSNLEQILGDFSLLQSNINFHLHDHCQITQCISGRIIYLFGNNILFVEPGDILVINDMTPHSWIVAEEGTVRHQLGFYPHSLNANVFSQCFLPYLRLLYSQHHPYIYIDTHHVNHYQISRCLDEIHEIHIRKYFAYDAIIHNQLFDLSVYLLFSIFPSERLESNFVSNEDIIKKAILFIEQNIEYDLSISAIAKYVGMNSSYFSYYFKKHLGIPYKKYVMTQRIAKAASLLQYSDHTITQILFECGFLSVSAFYQAFCSIYSMSPAQFRKLRTMTAQMPLTEMAL